MPGTEATYIVKRYNNQWTSPQAYMCIFILWYSSLVCLYVFITSVIVHSNQPGTLPDQEHQGPRSDKDVTPPEVAASLPQSGLRMRMRGSEAGLPLLAEHKYSKGFTGLWTILAQRCHFDLICKSWTLLHVTYLLMMCKVTDYAYSAWPLLCNFA